MEQESQASNDGATRKKTAPKRLTALKKVDAETSKLLQQLKEKANKKPYGRKVTDAEILGVAVRLVTPEHLRQLQDATYSEQERLQMVHDDFQKTNGKISLDQFIGKLLRGEIGNSTFEKG